MSRIQTTDNDKGWKKIVEDVSLLSKSEIVAGIISSNNPTVDGVTVAEYGFFNEVGTKRIPARPFISSTADRKRQEWNSLIERGYNKVLQGTLDVKQFVVGVGLRASGDIKKTITAISTPPNAPSTIARKKSSSPLIDTGLMRQLISFELRGI